MSAATPKRVVRNRVEGQKEFKGHKRNKLTQGGYPSVVTNVFDPTDKRICGSSPFGPIN